MYAKVSVFMAKEGNKHLGWKDGHDAKHPLDSGRGITDESKHKEFALKPANRIQACYDVATRFRSFSKLSEKDFAGIYADVSVIMAGYGVKHLRWKDGQDSGYPYDPGRGVKDYASHRDFALRQENRLLAAQDISIRFMRMCPELKTAR